MTEPIADASTRNETSSTKAPMDLRTVLAAAVLGAAVALGGAYYFINDINQSITAMQANMPPVIVVDFGAIVASYPKEISEDEMMTLMQRTNDTFVRLKDAGYMVLDAQAVISAPKDLYLPVEAFAEITP